MSDSALPPSEAAPVAEPVTSTDALAIWSDAGVVADRIAQQGFTVSVLGDFNPVIFHPHWFVESGLLSEEEVMPALLRDAETYVTPLMASWAVSPYQVRVSQAVFLMETYSAEQERLLLDALRQVFTLTPHSPVRQIEIERFVHYRTGSEAPTTAGSATETVGDPTPAVSAAMNRLTMPRLWDTLLPGGNAETVTVAAVTEDHIARISVQPSTVYADWLYVTASEGYVAIQQGPATSQRSNPRDTPTVLNVIESQGEKAIERTRSRIAETLRAIVG